MSSVTITFTLAQIQELVNIAKEAIARGESSGGVKFTISSIGSSSPIVATTVPVAAAAAASSTGTDPLTQEQLVTLLTKGFYAKSQTRAMSSYFTKWGLPESVHKAARDQWVVFAKANGRVENPKDDPEREKRPSNPYMRFANANRDKVKAENPTMSPREITSLLGARWKAMTEAEKAPYVAEFNAEKSSRSPSTTTVTA